MGDDVLIKGLEGDLESLGLQGWRVSTWPPETAIPCKDGMVLAVGDVDVTHHLGIWRLPDHCQDQGVLGGHLLADGLKSR